MHIRYIHDEARNTQPRTAKQRSNTCSHQGQEPLLLEEVAQCQPSHFAPSSRAPSGIAHQPLKRAKARCCKRAALQPACLHRTTRACGRRGNANRVHASLFITVGRTYFLKHTGTHDTGPDNREGTQRRAYRRTSSRSPDKPRRSSCRSDAERMRDLLRHRLLHRDAQLLGRPRLPRARRPSGVVVLGLAKPIFQTWDLGSIPGMQYGISDI